MLMSPAFTKLDNGRATTFSLLIIAGREFEKIMHFMTSLGNVAW